jgi:hypothetical protein
MEKLPPERSIDSTEIPEVQWGDATKPTTGSDTAEATTLADRKVNVSHPPQAVDGSGNGNGLPNDGNPPDSAATTPPILYGSVSDRPARQDSLGFLPYVSSLADFLTSPRTHPPLTISIEGAWGSGKSSFMNLLQEELRSGDEKARIVEFNAWRHDREDALWAAFALEFVRQLRSRLPLWDRLGASAHLFWSRFRWSEGWTSALRIAFLVAILIISAVSVPLLVWQHGPGWASNLVDKLADAAATPTPSPGGSTNGKSQEKSQGENHKSRDPLYAVAQIGIQAGGWTGTITLVVYLLYLVKKSVGNPFEIKLRKHLATPDYEGRTSFIENFHQDFQRVLDAYVKRPSADRSTDVNKSKIYVFIDDLDRCELPKAAELMNAINLLISDDDRLIFILGIDRQKVAAGIAFKYKELLPFLAPNAAVSERQPEISNELSSNSNSDPKGGQASSAQSLDTKLNFGYAFLEKFIQVPFRLPNPGTAELDRFLTLLSAPRTTGIEKSKKLDFSELRSNLVRERDAAKAYDEPEAPYVRQIALWLAGTFSSNPRRLKQFVNLFRLRLHIAHRTGKLQNKGERPALTPEQLGKLTAIFLRWPNFIEDWCSDPMLLAGLQLAALKPLLPSFRADPWFGNLELRRLLRLDPITGKDAEQLDVKARLDEIDVDDVLSIAPVKLSPVWPVQAREELAGLARDYEELRQIEPQPSPGRTQRMNAIFWRMQKLVRYAQLRDDQVRLWFNGSEGQRIAALAVTQSTRSFNLLDEVIDSIENQRSGYDQYRALRSAILIEPKINQADLRSRLRHAILSAQEKGTISDRDPSRFDLAKMLLDLTTI